MASKTKHYTSLEKKIFLDIFKEYKDVIEAKKSDTSTLREKAEKWAEIGRKYNNSFQINEERTVVQLKKLWTNLRQGQRNALTPERQAAMATGGGPQKPSVEIDPDIAMIAPHLMQVAPSNFSSNISEDYQNDYMIQIAEHKDYEEPIEYLDVVLLEEGERSLPGTSSASSQAITSENPKQHHKKLRVAEKRQRTCTESSSQSSCTERIERDTTKLQRVVNLHQEDQELYAIKKQHELKVSKVKECHLNVMNRIREEHLVTINELEVRKATAEAELAELRLAREKNHI